MFLTGDCLEPLVKTTVAGPYLASVPEQPSRSDARDGPKVDDFRERVSSRCFCAASAVERVLDQLGDAPDRIVLSRTSGIAFVFLDEARYAMLESDEEGALIGLLCDRSSDSEAETWVVESTGLTAALRKIRSFLGSPHGTHP